MQNQGVILLFIYFENKDMMEVMDMMKFLFFFFLCGGRGKMFSGYWDFRTLILYSY